MLKEKLTEALAKKSNDVNSYVWKGKKVLVGGEYTQSEVKMVDCSIKELEKFLEHCNSMLYSDNVNNPGRYRLLDIIREQREKCNCELFMRWLEKERELSRYVFLASIRECLNNNPQIDSKTDPIKCIVGGCPKEFENIPIDLVIEACLDTLGYFSKQHITTVFLLKHGIWFSQEDLEEIKKKGVVDRLEYAQKKLGIWSDPNMVQEGVKDVKKMYANMLKLNPKGLSLEQMFSMITLSSKKYSEMTTQQLTTLRNRVLFSLENQAHLHIQQWEKRIAQIQQVIAYKQGK